MKIKMSIILLTICLLINYKLIGQGFQKPTKGNAVIYFVRVTSYGFGVTFQYFHQDKYIGEFKGKNYMRYECDPGNQLLWASSENKEFITADLKEGESYIVIVDVIIGMMKGHVGLRPISINDKELFEKAKKMILEEAPVTTPEIKIEKMNKKLEEFIFKQLKLYDEKWKNERNYKHLSADMAIPADAMK